MLRYRTRGTPRRSTKTCTLSWTSWGSKQSERWTNWEKTCDSLIALWTRLQPELSVFNKSNITFVFTATSLFSFTTKKNIFLPSPLMFYLISPWTLFHNLTPFYFRFSECLKKMEMFYIVCQLCIMSVWVSYYYPCWHWVCDWFLLQWSC